MSKLNLALGALTGGTTGALDKIDGDLLSDGDAATVVLDSGVYHYHLDASSGESENSPYVISPDTNAGTKRWILQIPKGPFSHVKAESTAGQTGIASATPTKINFAVEIDDDLAEYTTSNSTFTAKYAGYYSVSCGLLLSGSWTSNQRAIIKLYKNAGFYEGFGYKKVDISTTSTQYIRGTTTIKLAANDTLNIYIDHDLAGNLAIVTIDDYNIWNIDRIA